MTTPRAKVPRRSAGAALSSRRAEGSPHGLGFYAYTVGDVMTPAPIVVGPEDPLRLAAERMSQQGISGLPVVSPDGTVAGVLSYKDVLRVLHERAGLAVALGIFDLLLEAGEGRRARLLASSRATLAEVRVAEAMSRPPVTIEAESSIDEAVQQMMKRRINRLPVLRKRQLVGIVTRHDLLTSLGIAGIPPGAPTG